MVCLFFCTIYVSVCRVPHDYFNLQLLVALLMSGLICTLTDITSDKMRYSIVLCNLFQIA